MIRILVTLFCVLLIAACGLDDNSDESIGYNTELIKESRAEKDEEFKDGSQSPLPEYARATFKGLKYFEPNEEYVVDATLERTTKPDTFRIQTSTSEIRAMLRVGKLKFTLQGKTCFLWAYSSFENREELFVPFTDRTNGNSTYEAGRYLNVEVLESDTDYVLDFNEAYNPYCAYNQSYSCPLVPRENNIPLEVLAGEQSWH